ncbi:hypothetical protein PHPALM_30970 [Phytophthora palmivora]|uniref:Uncharacterized protein n=1 Tax=Phytophthora palmivora TaxID=4796 RepID=A0A2P4X3S8_9STRA|nr:hypothetical protein PHPALM_30970 [Phytophthora palmivora]
MLKQNEEKAVYQFSRVTDQHEFISEVNRAPDVVVTLKVCCLSSERRHGCRANRVTGEFEDIGQFDVAQGCSDHGVGFQSTAWINMER